MLTNQQLFGAVCAIALRDGFTQLDAAREAVERRPDLHSKECFIALNEFESDIIAADDITGSYKNTVKFFFMSIAKKFQAYRYNPEDESVEPIERQQIVDRIMDTSSFESDAHEVPY